MNTVAAILSFIIWMATYFFTTEWLVPKWPLQIEGIKHENDGNWWAPLLTILLSPYLIFGWLIPLYFIIEKPF